MSGQPASQRAARNSRNLAHLRQVTISGAARSNDNVLSSLRAAQISSSRPVLPAELLAMILDYLPVPDLMRFARVSHRLQEMVYDDTRWIQKLKAIGVWNEAEARQRFEDLRRRKIDAQVAQSAHPSHTRARAGSTTLFDASAEESSYRRSLETAAARASARRPGLPDGFEDLTASSVARPRDPKAALTVLSRVVSARGHAREGFGKIYAALSPLYDDLARARHHSDAALFRTYRDPEQQAQILSSLLRYARCDPSQGAQQQQQRLDSIIAVFETAVLREFEQGCAAADVDGRMHRYAHVLDTLNGGSAAIDFFLSSHPLMQHSIRAGDPLDCLEAVAPGHVDLTPSRVFFERLTTMMLEQADVIDRVFPPSADVLTPFLSRLCEHVIGDYLTALFDEAHTRGIETYVKAVAGTFAQALRFAAMVKPTKASPNDINERTKQMVTQTYERHIDLYLAEELALFRSKANAEVSHWEKELSEQEASAESFLMSNVNRQAAKRDFLSSFKKVIMLPVNVLPVMSAKPAAVRATGNLDTVDTSYGGPRSGTPLRSITPQQPIEAPTTALAAKAAVMNSRLEGIRSLFSLEVALSLTHLAKSSIERVALMVQMGGSIGEDARSQCGNIFVALLDILGDHHVRAGFDKAVGHLSSYDPRQVREFRAQALKGEQVSNAQVVGVEPLVTFLELVNLGDLIQQMIDVFYVQELVATKLTDRDDFLNPTVKDKKRFESMLDERVAAGLNKGIDVLMDEVEYICATTQAPTDFNPGALGTDKSHAPAIVDIGPSSTATQVVDMVGSHTGMLVGSTDKNMLDVFFQEVGLRLFGVLCKHFKRQRISVDGAIRLISDINHYSAFVATLRQKPLAPYFHALRELAQIYLISIEPPTNLFTANASGKRGSLLAPRGSRTAAQAKELAAIIADEQRYHGVLNTQEVYEFAERRADWYLVRSDAERAMYGMGCVVM